MKIQYLDSVVDLIQHVPERDHNGKVLSLDHWLLLKLSQNDLAMSIFDLYEQAGTNSVAFVSVS